MLSPRYLDGLSDELVEIYSQLESDILQDMARRLSRLSQITDATRWQARLLVEAGGLKQHIPKILKQYDQRIIDAVTAVYTEAQQANTEADNRIFKEATGRTVSEANAQILLATIQKAHSDLSRLTLTTAATTQELFVQKANQAFMQTQSGAFDYNTALKHAADDMAERGITTVQYENSIPVTRTIESAIRMNILTGINQTAAAVTMNNCEELGCDLVETSAHRSARPSHQKWQGRIFSLSGTSTKYPPFSQCRFGEKDGICGINCRHSFYPYFEGMHRHYTQDDLDELSKETVTYNGRELPRYDAEQMLRNIERNIRKYKRRALTEEAAGVDSSASRIRLGRWQKQAREFTKQTGIRRDYTRERVGTKGQQPKGITPQIAGLQQNIQRATQIKRLDNARKKELAHVTQGKPMNFRQADGGAPNPNYRRGGGYKTNCQSCVVTYELRRRGFDLEALPRTAGSMAEVLAYNTNIAWIDRTTGKPPAYIATAGRTLSDRLEWIRTHIEPEKRYTMQWTWQNRNAGHIVHVYKNKNNELSVYDPQIGINHRKLADIYSFMNDCVRSSIMLLNVEDCDVNMNVVNYIVQKRT